MICEMMQMKYIIFIGDGMADLPIEELGGKTPLQAAKTPNLDKLSNIGRAGQLITLVNDLPLGSDVANLAILGYDVRKCYTGRGPLEAAALGIKLNENDIAFRCNTICVEGNKIKNHSGGHIPTEESRQLIETINKKFGTENLKFYPGFSYRHIMVLSGEKFSADIDCTPPHDVPGALVKDVLIKPSSPKGKTTAEYLNKLILGSKEILENHNVNIKRKSQGKDPANMIWPWSPGKRPSLETFHQRFGIRGAVISAVDLIKGLGIFAGFDVINVEGATGLYNTNYEGKAEACIKALNDHDLVYVHVEAPDEASHEGNLKLKIKAIEDFDKRLVGNVLKKIDINNTTIVVLPDHLTPIKLRTHIAEPVPFVIYKPGESGDNISEFSEISAKKGFYGLIDNQRFINILFRTTKLDKTINIKGEVCPYTFVKTKLALEQLESGQVLEVITDHMPAVRNVTRNCEEEGHEIVEKKQINETDWHLIIKKK